MSVQKRQFVEYIITCDICGVQEVCPDACGEQVFSKAEAIKWAGMHRTKYGIMCEECFCNRKNHNWKFTNK